MKTKYDYYFSFTKNVGESDVGDIDMLVTL